MPTKRNIEYASHTRLNAAGDGIDWVTHDGDKTQTLLVRRYDDRHLVFIHDSQLYRAWQNLSDMLAHKWDGKPYLHPTKKRIYATTDKSKEKRKRKEARKQRKKQRKK